MKNININSLSRISIGSSLSDSLQINLFSKIELTDDHILTIPFGTTRTRFNSDPVFDYHLVLISNNDQEYHYQLNINKKKELRRTFFWNEGWTLDLKLTILPKTFNILDIENLYQNIPENYGKILINNNHNINHKYQVGIIIPTFGRLEYLKKCLESLNNSQLNDVILIIIDESITKDVDYDKIQTNRYLKQFQFSQIPVIKIFKKEHGNMHDSILTGFDLLVQSCQYLITMDSDTIHNKYWLKSMINTYQYLEQNTNVPIVLSGFNTDSHPIKEDKGNYYLKFSLGGCCLMFNSNIYYYIIRYCLVSHKWDTNITTIINQSNGILATTRPSVIEHIGEKSSVRAVNNYVKTFDFVY